MRIRKNLYQILQVQPEASVDVIKAAYRALMKSLKHHPDLGGSHRNASLINEAYHTLVDPRRREKYDRTLSGSEESRISPLRPHQPHSTCPVCRGTLTNHDPCPRCHHREPSKSGQSRRKPEKRRWARIQQVGDQVHFTESPKSEAQGRIVDLSPDGMQFHSPYRIALGKIITVRSQLFKATARVIRCRGKHQEETYVVGVVFLTISFMKNRGTFVSISA